jgi:ankyrin repeat protein
LIRLVNAQSDEGYTPIMFAAFRGNIVIYYSQFKDIIMRLEKIGADIHAKNNKGLGVFHLAAQRD